MVLAVAGVVLWLAVRDDDATSARRAPATAASIARLTELARAVGHPIYWAGSQPRFTYELSRAQDGRIYIRYLPPGVEVGNSNANYLTVGTYPQRNAFAMIRTTAAKQGVEALDLPGGGVAFQYRSRPTSVYLAYPGSNYQIEVFDPSPARALRLVTSGQIRRVVGGPTTRAASQAVSPRQLQALALTLGHPVYWAGREHNETYELTRTRDGSVYIRYLPARIPVGDRTARYLTIGTYPQTRALELLRQTAARKGVPTLRVAGGGVAFVDRKRPTSVYVAYPNADVQIEVYDPRPGRARQLVTSGRIVPIG